MSFTIKGIRIQITFSFLAVLLLMVEHCGSNDPLWCVVCCLIHEMGHIIAYLCCGTKPKELLLEAGGLRIVPPDALLSVKQEAFVLAGGIAANLRSAGVLLMTGAIPAAGMHLFLAAFNLLPLAPLDGGQLLALLLRNSGLPSADRIAEAVHLIFWLALVGGGLLLLHRTGNFTLLLTLLCMVFP